MTETGLEYGAMGASLLGLVLLGVVSAAGWWLQPKHRYALWLGLGHMAVALWWWQFLAAGGQLGLLWLAGWCLASLAWPQAVAERMGLRLHMGWVLGVSLGGMVALLVGGNWAATAAPQLQALGLMGIWGLLWVQPLVRAWQAPQRHRAEVLLLVSMTLLVAAALVLAAVALLAWQWELWMPVAELGDWRLAAVTSVLVGLWLTAALGWCWVTDNRWYGGRWAAQRGAAAQGVLSRAAFEAACGETPHARGIRVMLLCDIDDFGQLSEQHGAAAAQQIVQCQAQILRDTLREGDWLGHLGADEFSVALRHVPLDGASQLIARIRQRMARTVWLQGQDVQVTASFGVVQVQPHDRLDWLLHRADVLLYLAKDAGHSQTRGDGIAANAR